MTTITKFLGGLLMGLALTAHAGNNATIIKSDNDQRDYAYHELDNGMKLLAISDKDAQRAAVAVDVDAGTSAEPDEFPGLAHFLEHMLFLGTDQYPDPDDYINYISDHGGNHNAFTAFDHTNYFFDIDPDYLHEGLKRFSRFFVAPLMSEKYVERERNAVDSEYQSKLREDPWRSMDTLKQAVNPKHPYARFSIGNNKTLPNETVRPALLKFYEKYYSADRMSAVIIGKEDTATLLKWGKTLFADVPKRAKTDLSIHEQLFKANQLPLKIVSQSIKNEKNLSLYFQFPYIADNQYSKSLGYLSYILGYEGEGSLLETLKQLGYASELYSGAGYRIGDETSFEIGVQLTDKGYEHPDQVTAIIFAYIELLKNDTNGEKRYQEIATVSETAFRFKEKRDAIHEVSGLATRLNRYPVKDVQALNAVFSGYNKAQITDYLAQMTPKNAVIQLTAPDVQSKTTTHYFDVPYAVNAIKPDSLTQIAATDKTAVAQMHLPNANPFLAKNYDLHSDKVGEKQITLANGIELYFKNDTSFRVPRSSVQLSLQPMGTLSITDKTAMSLLAGVIDEQLITTLYDASIAGLRGELNAGEKSVAISLEGYQENMPHLLEVMLKQLKTAPIDKETFDRVKTNYRQDLENASAQMPYQQTFPYVNQVLTADASLPAQRLAVLDSIDAKALTAFRDKLLKKLAVRMIVYGNNTYAEAEQLANTVTTVLDKTDLKNTWQGNHANTLTQSVAEQFDVNHQDNAITYYIQGDKGYPARAQIGLLAKMIEPQFFTKLRTEMQLGYVVFAYPRPAFNQSGIAFTIQSPVATADELEKHITQFNVEFANSLDKLTEADFDAVKTILKGELLQKPENLMSAANIYWSDILTTDKTASSRQAIAHEIDQVKLSDFIKKMKLLLTERNRAIIKGESALK